MPEALGDEALHAAGDVTNKHNFFALTYPFERCVKIFKLIKTVNQWVSAAAGLGHNSWVWRFRFHTLDQGGNG